MKRFYLLVFLSFLTFEGLYAQTIDGQISLFPLITNEDIPSEALQNLTNRLNRAIALNGYGSYDDAERFILVANVDVVSNDVVPSTPPRVSKKVEISMIIGDVIENKTFGSCCVTLAGIGQNDNKAYISAFNSLNPSAKAIKDMFKESEQEISVFYSNSSLFITKAHTYSNAGDYDKAIAYLMTIPSIDAASYELCQNEMAIIYQQKIDKEGEALYNKASGVWKSTRNLKGAKEVAAILNDVDPYSSIMPKIDVLWTDISAKLRADELAAIEAEKRAHEERMKQAELNAESAKRLISAAKAVGVAFGIFQPKIVVNRIVRHWF